MTRRRFFAKEGAVFKKENYLTFEALEDGFTFIFPVNTEYNIDGVGWEKLNAGEESPAINNMQFISVRSEYFTSGSGSEKTFVISKQCNLSGNCMSLLVKDKARDLKSLESYPGAFVGLFRNCKTIQSVSRDFLPATTLAFSCYKYMFYGCTGLVNAPELPATTLASFCYCYMFEGCTNLNYIKMLATDISENGCLFYWVYRVSPTGTFVKSKDATWDVVGDSGVPTGWTVITDDQEGGSVGKTINKITATISEDMGEVTATLSSLYPVASDVYVYLVTNAGPAFCIFNTGKTSINCYQIGTFQEIYLDTTEDDTYIYELEVII